MFNNTLNQIGTILKEGLGFVKTVTIGTLTAVKDDCVKISQDAKDFKAFQEWKKSQQDSKPQQ